MFLKPPRPSGLFIGRRNHRSLPGAGLLQAVFSLFLFEVSLFLSPSVTCSPHPAPLLPGHTCRRGHRHRRCPSWSGARLLWFRLKCWRHLRTEPVCVPEVLLRSPERFFGKKNKNPNKESLLRRQRETGSGTERVLAGREARPCREPSRPAPGELRRTQGQSL